MKHHFGLSLAYINITFLIYSIVPIAHQFLKIPKIKPVQKGRIPLIANSFLALAYNGETITTLYPQSMVSWVTLAYSATFLAMAQDLSRRNLTQRPAFSVLLAMAMFFIVLTVPFAFSGVWISFSWALLGAVLYWLSERLHENRIRYLAYGVLFVAFMRFFGHDVEPLRFSLRHWWRFRDPAYPFWQRLLLYGSLGASTFVLTRSALRGWVRALPYLFLFYVGNIEVSSAAHVLLPNAVLAAVSIFWALTTLILMLVGTFQNRPHVRYAALALFSLCSLKLFFMDMPRYHGGAYLIVDLITVSVLLLASAYCFIRYRAQTESSHA